MDTKAEAKVKADTCARLAAKVADPVHRVALLALQGQWLALVDNAEKPGYDASGEYQKLLDVQAQIIKDAISRRLILMN